MTDDVLFLSIRELGELIRNRQVSPVELTQAYLLRSQKLGPKYNAYVTLTEELALKQARAAEQELASGHDRGPLHGIPYAAKDLVAVAGYPTTWGARPLRNQKFDYNAAVIDRLSEAGAVLIGKAAMIELAGGLGYTNGFAAFTGPARNPWNTDYWTCGSSSGSGAIVSASLAPFALGSDTRGSILCPSSHCGISGLRPSFGRVSRYGAMAIAWTMDKLGPMCRTAEDCGLVLSAMAGHDPKDHDSLPQNLADFSYSSTATRKFRIGKITNAFRKLPADLESAIDAALAVLEKQGATVTEVKIPDGAYEEAAELTILMEAASSFQELIKSGKCAELDDPLGRINGYPSMQFSSNDYLQVQRVRTFLQANIDKLFDEFDGSRHRVGIRSSVFIARAGGKVAHPAAQAKRTATPPDAGTGWSLQLMWIAGDQRPLRLQRETPSLRNRLHGSHAGGREGDSCRSPVSATHRLAPPAAASPSLKRQGRKALRRAHSGGPA